MNKLEDIDIKIAELQQQRRLLKKEQELKDMEYLRSLEWLNNKTAVYEEYIDEDAAGEYGLRLKDNIEDILKIVNQPLTLIDNRGNKNVYIVNNVKSLLITAYNLEVIVELAEEFGIKVTLPEKVKIRMQLFNRLQCCE